MTGFINGENAFMLVECVFPVFNTATTIGCGYKPFRAQFERIACPVAQKEKKRKAKIEDPKALFEYRCNRNTLLFHQFQIMHLPVGGDDTDNVGCLS